MQTTILNVRVTTHFEYDAKVIEDALNQHFGIKGEFVVEEAAQQSAQDGEYCTDNCIDDPEKIGWLFCPYCGKKIK